MKRSRPKMRREFPRAQCVANLQLLLSPVAVLFLMLALTPLDARALHSKHSWKPITRHFERSATMPAPSKAWASPTQTQLQVSGTVYTATGETMPGANVLEKGTTNGTTTDSNGKYTLTVSDANVVLVFSFIG